MGRPRRSDSQVATTERLLTAAEKHFGKLGFDAARLSDIAKDAGITRPSLLYHFESKEKLYDAVVARAFDHLLGVFQGAVVQTDSFESIVLGLTQAYLDFANDYPSVSVLVLKELTGPSTQGEHIIRTKFVPVLDWVENFLIEAGQDVMRPGIPVRFVLMQVSVQVMIRSAMGELAEPMWGEGDPTIELSRILFLKD